MNSFAALALAGHALQFALVSGDAIAHPRHLALKLAQAVAAGHHLLLGVAALGLQLVQQRRQRLDLAAKLRHRAFLRRQRASKLLDLALHLAQVALHLQRTFGQLFAAGHGHVVEALAGERR